MVDGPLRIDERPTDELPRADPEPGAEPARARFDVGPVLMGLILVMLLIGVWFDGAFDVADWAPLAMLPLAALIVLGPGGRLTIGEHGFGLLLAAFGVWSVVSTFWSESASAGVESGTRNLLYAALALCVVATVPRRATAVRFGRFVLVGFAVLAGATLLLLLALGKDLILAGRLDTPVGYRNGAAAVLAMAAVACICAAAPRATNPFARAGAFALAVAALGLAYLTQSRGVAVGFACGALVAVLLGPDRIRRAWLTLAAVGVVAVVSSALLEPYDAFLDRSFVTEDEVRSASLALLVATVVAFAAMLGAALLDSGLRITETGVRRLTRVAVAALVLVGVGGAVAGIAKIGDPIAYADEKLEEFKELEPAAAGRTRLGSTSGQRYDLWRIAYREFRADPLIGGGEGSYPVRYYRERRTDRNLTVAHSLPLGALGDTGLIGLGLLVGAFGVAAVTVARRWRDVTPVERRVASALLGAGAVLIVQSSIDWLWSIAALAGLGIVTLAAGLRIVTAPVLPAEPPSRPTAVVWRGGALVAAALIACLFISATYLRLGRNVRDEPARAIDAAATAKRFAPWDMDPRYLRAGALESMGKTDAARKELADALQQEPQSFVTMALLGDLESRAGDREAARLWYARAAQLNPRDPGLQKLATSGG